MSIWANKTVKGSALIQKKESSKIIYPISRISTDTSSGEEREKHRSNSAQDVRLRRSSPTLVPSVSESSISDYDDDNSIRTIPPTTTMTTSQATSDESKKHLTLRKVANSILFKKRLSRQSSLSWGHKPSPLIGASCFLFLLPIPLLLRACCPLPAFFLGCITVSSYLSDHVYTGVESWAHTADRVLAPLAFASNLYSIYAHHGSVWALSSLAALKCHVLANYYSKRGMYDEFVIWHSLWHAVGVGLIVVCFAVNGRVSECWEGSRWEDILHDHFMI
mmetsp:Transcript_5903/g.10781  ORF Transcript_5903/g.10781 Transcript_5903/m.10781 type:complete len:277 (+) Transcript_5903:269-1099(+)